MKLQRLVRPQENIFGEYRNDPKIAEILISEREFGSSKAKYEVLRKFFGLAAAGKALVEDGQLEKTIDELFNNRRRAAGRRMAIGSETLFVLGNRNVLDDFQRAVTQFNKVYPLGQPETTNTNLPIAERLLLAYLQQSQTLVADRTGRELMYNTIGWLDMDSGSFAMTSMHALNSVRELFGLCPHVAMRAQNDYKKAYKLDSSVGDLML